GIEMIQDVEYAKTSSHFQVSLSQVKRYRPGHLQIERRKARKMFAISWPDVSTNFVFWRIGEPGVQVIDRKKGQLERRRNVGPKQRAVWCIKGESPTSVGLNHRLRVVAEKQRRIIQVSVSSRVDIGTVQGEAWKLIPAGYLELAVRVASSIGERHN